MCVAVPAALMRAGCGLTLFDEWCVACPHCILQFATFTGEANFEVNQHWSAVVDAVTLALTNILRDNRGSAFDLGLDKHRSALGVSSRGTWLCLDCRNMALLGLPTPPRDCSRSLRVVLEM